MKMMKTLKTWAGRSDFQYAGSVASGTSFQWHDHSAKSGWSKPWPITPGQYRELLSCFSGQEVRVGGTYASAPRPGTLEAWLRSRSFQWGSYATSYICSILIAEGYARHSAKIGYIKFHLYRVPGELASWPGGPEKDRKGEESGKTARTVYQEVRSHQGDGHFQRAEKIGASGQSLRGREEDARRRRESLSHGA